MRRAGGPSPAAFREWLTGPSSASAAQPASGGAGEMPAAAAAAGPLLSLALPSPPGQGRGAARPGRLLPLLLPSLLLASMLSVGAVVVLGVAMTAALAVLGGGAALLALRGAETPAECARRRRAPDWAA